MLTPKSITLFLFIIFQFFFVPVFAQSSSGKPAKSISRTYGFAGTLVDLGLYYSQTQATATPAAGNTWDSTTSIYDFKVGYIDESHIYFGALFSSRHDNQVSATQVSGNGAGVGLGYFGYGGVNLRGYYRFNDVYGEYKDGSGYQVDLGYAINPTSSFYIGLNLSIRETTFKTNTSIASFESWVRKETYPFITLGFLIF
jgi:hypothetical protein